VTKFGEALRAFRQASNDPDRLNRRLSQERLGELIGHEMGDRGFSGAAISDWERGESRISAYDRNVLIALILILHRCGGLQDLAEANQFLEAGNYRAFDTDEAQKIFQENLSDISARTASAASTKNEAGFPIMMWTLFFESPREFQSMLVQAKDGPPPVWPRVMIAVFRRFSDRLSVSSAWTFFLWVWVWLLAWALIAPSLRWPFPGQTEAFIALVLYAGGTIVIPAFIGMLTNTKDSEFWKEKKPLKDINLRLYTYQGASIGFHVGYFFVFMFVLLIYNLGFTPALWLELVAIAFPVFVGYASARLIPYNLLLAYKRLNLKDGAIFFAFFLLGPVWAYFFLEIYDILLARALGVFVFLLAMTIVAGWTFWQNRRKT